MFTLPYGLPSLVQCRSRGGLPVAVNFFFVVKSDVWETSVDKNEGYINDEHVVSTCDH